MFFKHIEAAPADPILGLGEAFKAETRPEKVNLGIGVYKDASGATPIVKAVKEAEKRLLESETTKNYLTIDGVADYNEQTQILLFGADHEIIAGRRAKTAQSLGGTGALRIAAEFAKRQLNAQTVWISNPTWPNHNAIFKAVGIQDKPYRYYDAAKHGLDWDGMIEDLGQAQKGDVVLLHGCCHNPTGIDPTPEQWETLAKLSAEKGWLPLFDFAYQGFGNGLEEDAYGLRTFLKYNKELLIASSYSKNFGMYNERVGAFTLVAEDEATAALDPENETFIQHAIGTLIKGKTVIVIAHRLRTVENADKIIVLNKGTIAETGTHAELMEKDGIYREMYRLQRESDQWSA